MPSTSRHFPPPWSAEVQPNYYVVRDADGQQLVQGRGAAKIAPKARRRRFYIFGAPPLHVRLATDVKDVAGHGHRHQDHHVTVDLHGPQFHGLPTGHLVLYKTGIAIRTASH